MLSNVVEKMDVKKVSIIIPSYLNGGSENFGINISNYYSKYFKVILLSLKNIGVLKNKIINNENFTSIDFGTSRNRYKIFKLFKFLKSQQTVFSVMRDTNILCLICSLFLPKLNVIIREGNRLNNMNIIYLFFLKLLYLRANKIIVNSRDIKQDIIKKFFFLERKLVILHNPIFSFKKKITKNTNKNKIILNISRMHKQKNHMLLLNSFSECLKKNKDLTLILIGEGPEEDNIRKKIHNLKINNNVKIFKPSSNLDKFYASVDLYVHTSKYEGFPNVLAEAISNSVYCVSTPSSSSVYDIIFDNQYGFITKSFCHKELSQIILNSLDRNGFDNSKFINKFYINSCGTKFLDLI